MKLKTRLVGEIEYEQDEVITFPQGLPSFREEQSFLLLPLEDNEGGPFCLQSITTPALAFILMDPFALYPGYAPTLHRGELRSLGVKQDEDLCFYVMCAMKRPVGSSTINLKCPIVINPDTRTARQVILETGDYHMRHPLSEFFKSEEGSVC